MGDTPGGARAPCPGRARPGGPRSYRRAAPIVPPGFRLRVMAFASRPVSGDEPKPESGRDPGSSSRTFTRGSPRNPKVRGSVRASTRACRSAGATPRAAATRGTCQSAISRAHVRIEPAPRGGYELVRYGRRGFRVLRPQPLEVGDHAVAQLLRGRPEVRARRRRGVVSVSTRARRPGLEIGGALEALGDQLGAHHSPLAAHQASPGLVRGTRPGKRRSGPGGRQDP